MWHDIFSLYNLFREYHETHNIYLTFKYNLHDGSTKEQSYYKEKRNNIIFNEMSKKH